MQPAHRLIEEIVSSSRIPSARRRREVLRELQAHVEDAISSGVTERLAVDNLGDPREIASHFAWVYRKERAVLRLSVFLLSTIAVAGSIAAIVMAMKAGIAIGFGVPLPRIFSPRHTLIEAIDILSTAAAYVGLLSLEKLFDRRHFPKSAALLALIFAALAAVFSMAGRPWKFLLFGLVAGIFLRTIQVLLKNQAARIVVVPACFGAIGLISLRPLTVASWVVTGLGYLAMTHLAVRVDRALFKGLQQL
ncbi:membrane hypothetical protein [Candidatus Sulfopaludibacter sp. SbA4]|nr:membrane hypothetical protein [Candidatus Sulfopaludibacter sp. SbA4]